MFQADRCRVLAAECRELALAAGNAAETTLLTNLALSWSRIANQTSGRAIALSCVRWPRPPSFARVWAGVCRVRTRVACGRLREIGDRSGSSRPRGGPPQGLGGGLIGCARRWMRVLLLMARRIGRILECALGWIAKLRLIPVRAEPIAVYRQQVVSGRTGLRRSSKDSFSTIGEAAVRKVGPSS